MSALDCVARSGSWIRALPLRTRGQRHLRRWLRENPYFQYFIGEENSRHELPPRPLLDDALARACERARPRRAFAGEPAYRPQERSAAAKGPEAGDGGHQAITFPSDGSSLLGRRAVGLSGSGRSYLRVGKFALMTPQRYAYPKQFQRQRREVKFLRNRLGRVMREIDRKTAGDPRSRYFRNELARAPRVRDQQRRQVGPLDAPEVECIGNRTNLMSSAARSRWPQPKNGRALRVASS